MAASNPPPARHARLLLSLLTQPDEALGWSPADWDLAVRAGRSAKLLGALHARLSAAGMLARIPQAAAQMLESDYRVSLQRAAMAGVELRAVAEALGDYDGPIVLLKGAAYAALGSRTGHGRIFEDVDLMVPRAHLQKVEDALIFAGWESETTDAYDQRYYREWSHELPPLRFPERPMQLDVHHTIVPVTSRYRPDAQRLFDMAQPVEGTRFAVLHPVHRLLHAAAHVFADSDCVSKLRDLVDIDCLAREWLEAPEAWMTALEEARRAQLERPLWYAIAVCRVWLHTPVPEVAEGPLAAAAPLAPLRWWMGALFARTLPPPAPEGPRHIARSIAARLLNLRYLWQRMPPRLLAYHAFHKAIRAAKERLRPSSAAEE